MLGVKRIVMAAALVALAYVAYPYVTLGRLGTAMAVGDAKTLESLVDWSQVREGIKEDICDGLAGDPTPTDSGTAGDGTAHDGTGLRPFGFSFVRGVAANVVDQHVSPHGFLAAARHVDPANLTLSALSGVKWAFFDSPTHFVAELQPPGMATNGQPVRVELELHGFAWKVTRVGLPPTLLAAANTPT